MIYRLPFFRGAELLANCDAFAPELILCAAIVLMLVLRLFASFTRVHMGYVALGSTLAALFMAVTQWTGYGQTSTPTAYQEMMQTNSLFTGLLVYDTLTVYLRIFLLAFMVMVIWLTLLTGIPDREDSADFYTLLIGSTIGMCLMASTNHLLMMFIGIEMASLPSYALAGFLKGRRRSSEAALKYVVYGGGAAGVMLYGISLLAGKFGTASLPHLAVHFATSLGQVGATGLHFDPLMILGTLFIVIGIAFKLAVVPFHFWCPDVFEGASAEVAGFLSVASKAAALALLARFALVLSGLDPNADNLPGAHWEEMRRYLIPTLAVFAIVTATFGNMAAYLQTNLKRLLAYSTIAHAGYMLMGLATVNREGTKAVLFYLVAYFLMNLGAFAIVAFLRNQTGSEDLGAFRGLVRRSPFMVVALSVCLLSLLGVPPLVGFVGKFQVFAALFDAAKGYGEKDHTLSVILYTTLVFGALNSVLSAFYYLKVMKVMILERGLEDVEGKAPTPLVMPWGDQLYAGVFSLALLGLGLYWGPLDRASAEGVERFRPEIVKAEVRPTGPPRGMTPPPGGAPTQGPGAGGGRPGGGRPGGGRPGGGGGRPGGGRPGGPGGGRPGGGPPGGGRPAPEVPENPGERPR